MADGKGKTVPGDRANVRKGALSLELVASVSNSESLSIIVIVHTVQHAVSIARVWPCNSEYGACWCKDSVQKTSPFS